jgi:hypothetical protein
MHHHTGDITVDIKKIIAKLPTGYAEDCAGYDAARLRAEIVTAETNLRAVKQEEKADEKLTGARELAKDRGGAYREAKVCQRAKIDYALHVLEARGELGVGVGGGGDEDATTGDARSLANEAQGRVSRPG